MVKDDEKLHQIMMEMPLDSRYWWCESRVCACMRPAHCDGKLFEAGFTKEDWMSWLEQHPKDVALREESPDWRDKISDIISDQGMVSAVKYYRYHTACGVREALYECRKFKGKGDRK